MKILTIGSDRKIFEEGSAVAQRQIKYSQLFERLDIIIYSLRKLKLKAKSFNLEANLNAYPTNSWSRFLYFIDAVRIARRLEKPDIVSAQDPFECGVAAYLCSRYWGVPLHLQVHTDFLSPFFVKGSTFNKVRVILAKFLIKRAFSVRVVTERVKKSIVMAGLMKADKITVLPIFINVDYIRSSPVQTDLHKKYPQFDHIILMASRITREKNIALAIEAMREIVNKYPKVGLVIVGDGPETENLKLLSTHYSLLTNIIFEPWQNDLASYYKTADLFLLTSNYEGYGMTIIEALSAGLPVIMSDVGVVGEVLVNEKNGLIFAVGDLKKLVSSIERFISDPVFRGILKENLKNFNYGWSEAKYLEEYKKSLTI